MVRRLLGALAVIVRRELSEDVELLVPRHENTVLRRHAGKPRYTPSDRMWLAAPGTARPDFDRQRAASAPGPHRVLVAFQHRATAPTLGATDPVARRDSATRTDRRRCPAGPPQASRRRDHQRVSLRRMTEQARSERTGQHLKSNNRAPQDSSRNKRTGLRHEYFRESHGTPGPPCRLA